MEGDGSGVQAQGLGEDLGDGGVGFAFFWGGAGGDFQAVAEKARSWAVVAHPPAGRACKIPPRCVKASDSRDQSGSTVKYSRPPGSAMSASAKPHRLYSAISAALSQEQLHRICEQPASFTT